MDDHVHRKQAGALKCQAVENKINCKAEHPHLPVFSWQTSLGHPQVLGLALCCRQQGMTGEGWAPASSQVWAVKEITWVENVMCYLLMVSNSLFLIQWGKYTPLFWNKSQTQSSITEHALPPPTSPPGGCCSFISDKNSHPDLQKEELVFLPPATFSSCQLCKAPGLHHDLGGKIQPEIWYSGHLKTAQWEQQRGTYTRVCSATELWRKQDTGYASCLGKACNSLGKKAWPFP